MEEREKAFDEKAKEALLALFENFWILREDEPQLHQKVREREKVVSRYVSEKFGYRLIVHRHFAKLEKIPAEPEAWMGIQDFKERLDYALFCCLLAFLESKSVDEQFLLSEVCEEIEGMYPGEEPVDWVNYEHRKSLIRVLQKAQALRILKIVDGEVEGFASQSSHEVLYEVPVVARYFMRSYPKDFFRYHTIAEILEEEWKSAPDDLRRHRIYRQLFLSPVIYRREKDDPDFYYLRNFRNRLRADVEEHTDFQYELYKNMAMLTLPERKSMYTLFPDQKGISDLMLQFSSVLRRNIERFAPNEFGHIRLSKNEFEELLAECQREFAGGWSKAHRDMALPQLYKEMLEALIDWKMAYVEDTGMIYIYPLAGRSVGRYPADFERKEAVSNE
ncbi:MAG: TIGR02678 family protein [Ectobacillus sp.]